MHDSQLWRLLQTQQIQIQPSQPQLQPQGVTNSALREENASALAEVPKSPGGSSLVMTNTMRRQNSQNARVNVNAQYLQSANPSLVSPTANTLSRDQRWMSANGSDGLAGQMSPDVPAMLPDHTLRRMRGSISNPQCQTNYASRTLGLASQASQVPQGPNGHLSRFSPGIPSSWNDPMTRPMDPLPQSIQTVSTLVTDFDNWLDTMNDL